MSESKRQYPFNFGRVFFPEKSKAIPNKIYFQPLENHVRNVIQLVKAWNIDDFPGATLKERQDSLERVVKAAAIHDKGKPQRFKLDVKTNQKDKFKEYTYSFKGHRYLANHPDIGVETLAIGHHDFSVNDISRDTYKLKKESQTYSDILAKEPLTYARELYILEMCDQIEAELACRVIGDDEQADSRTFMDYTTKKKIGTSSEVYLIDPCPFKENNIFLTFQYWSMELSQADKDSLQVCIDKEQDSKLGNLIDRIAKDWWQSQQGKPEKAEPKSITLESRQSDTNLKSWNCESLYKALGGEQFIPNPMQQEVFEAIVKNNPAFMFKSPTGSGKLEAVLFPALAQGYRLILPLPARSLLEDQKERIEKYLIKLSKTQPNREISLVVDTGVQMYRWVYWNGEDITSTLNINSRRHLYKGDVILTTIDKFLYRYFAFGDKQKSFIFPLRINQEKTLICFDEAHTYDEISFTNFHSLVKALYEAGRSLILMTATMPEYISERFDYLELIDYVDISDNANKLREFQLQTLNQRYVNQRSFEWIIEVKRDRENPDRFQSEFTNIILKQCQAKENCKIICVVETVTDAAAIYEKLIKQLGLNLKDKPENVFLYHGRIAEQLRTELYNRLKQRDSGNQSYILITTSAIEVGCDLNCEILISQICPPENLIQRVGRCNRKGNFLNAKVILVSDEIPGFANSLDETEWENYKNKLQSLKQFDTQKIQKCISHSQQVDDYRVVELFSMLHEYVYQADITFQYLHKRGLIPTRSWTPSVKLEFHGEQEQIHSISVPIDRLCSETKYANTHVYQRKYDQENTKWEMQPLSKWGSAYNKEIVVKIYRDKEGVIYDAELEDYQYEESLGFVKLPKIFIKLKTNSADEKLLYLEGDRKAIITYTKSLAKTPSSQE